MINAPTNAIDGDPHPLWYQLVSINVGPPRPTLKWSPPSLEPANQQSSFAYGAETKLTGPLRYLFNHQSDTYEVFSSIAIFLHTSKGVFSSVIYK